MKGKAIKNMKNKGKISLQNNDVKMLAYAAVALSFVSFMTTMNGVKGIITDNAFYAGFISFGIQTIILVMGLWFVPVMGKIYKQRINKFLKNSVFILMPLLYLCAIVFSSFFSFVYMSNAAYNEVRLSDYNVEIELFLVENTREVKNINNAINDVLLQNIRETAPKFRDLMDDYQKQASQQIKDITDRITKYTDSVIATDLKFSAQAAINAYEGANSGGAANAKMVADCQRLEHDINQYITYYNERYYPAYSNYFDDITAQVDSSQASARKADIESTINSMQSQVGELERLGYTYNSIGEYVKARCNSIISQYTFLIEQMNRIINAYDEILTHPDVIQGEGLILQNFYESIYSSDTMIQEDLDKAISELQQIISTYIKNSETVDSELVDSLVICIENLDKLNKCKDLKDEIERFEKENLAQTYIVSLSDVQNCDSSTDSETNVSTNTESPNMKLLESDINRIQETEWNEARHNDVAKFITLVKSLPDLDLILSESDKSESVDNTNIIYLRTKNDENFISSVLAKSYEYSRAKLENISDMERAWNYLSSDNNFLAIFCFLIALFLDIASFLIGLCMHANQKETK